VSFDGHLRIIEPAIVIKNNGQTPAYMATVYIQKDILSTDHKVFDLKGATIKKFQSIHKYQGGSTQMLVCIDELEPRVLKDGEGIAIGSGKMSFFCWGRVVYSDVFRSEHTTSFRFQFDMRNGRFTPPILCEEGNEAD
jgi:hypothetical protein